MQKETCKKILKVTGIILIVYSVLILAVAAYLFLSNSAAEVAEMDKEEAVIAAVVYAIAGLLGIAQGVINISAANKATKGITGVAMGLALFSLCSNISTRLEAITSGDIVSIVITLLGLVLDVLVAYGAVGLWAYTKNEEKSEKAEPKQE
jgi:flagellar basal body-associated protein FliL